MPCINWRSPSTIATGNEIANKIASAIRRRRQQIVTTENRVERLSTPLMGIKRFDHETKVKARSERRNLQAASQLYTKQVGTGEINQIIESLLKVKVQRITKTY